MAMKIGFIGCGKMGGAVLAGALRAKVFSKDDVWVLERSDSGVSRVGAEYGVEATLDVDELEKCDVVVLAIKPQQLNDLKFVPRDGALIVSILAGTKLIKLQNKYPLCKVVRVMPNLAHGVGLGATAIYWGETDFSNAEEKLVRDLFSAGGEIFEVDKENMIDVFGATGGTGPAYFCALLDGFARASVARGFSVEDADRLARQTFLGAGKLLEESPEISFDQWIKNVCSPGGTTEQAMRVYGEEDLVGIVDKAVGASVERAEELAGE